MVFIVLLFAIITLMGCASIIQGLSTLPPLN